MTRTVVVRLFQPAPATGGVELAGLIEDVAGRVTEPFTCTAELLDALQRIAGTDGDGAGVASEPD